MNLGRDIGRMLACAAAAALLSGCASASLQAVRLDRYRPQVEPLREEAAPPAAAPEAGVPAATARSTETVTNRAEAASSGARVLKAGDRIMIYKRGIPTPEEVMDVVDDRGNVSLTLVGTLHVAGTSTTEAEALIEKAYVEGGFYRTINVIIVQQEDEYFMRGEVKREGRFPLSRDLTLLQAIATAGGYTDFADHRNVKVIRKDEARGTVEMTFDAYRIEELKDRDPPIRAGDIVIVQRRPWYKG